MTTNKHVASGAAAACPDAEALSCFIDAELPDDRMVAIRSHVPHCPTCTDVLAQMQGLDNGGNTLAGCARGDGCPDGETLAGYLAGGLTVDQQRTVDAHVLSCDGCAYALAAMHRTLRRSWTLDARVPALIVERALAAAQPRSEYPRGVDLHRPPQVPKRIPTYLRLPVLLPTAFAAGIAVFFTANAGNLLLHTRVEQTRSAGVHSSNRRVTVSEALVRSEPTDTAAVIDHIAPGRAVEVQSEEREWLLVSLPNGARGWIPRRAFE